MSIIIQQQGVPERYRDFDMYAPSGGGSDWTAWHKDADDDSDNPQSAPNREVLMGEVDEWHADRSWERVELYRLRGALKTVTDLFALPDEDSMSRFERLAAWFRKDTGYLAPGKDQPMGGADQPDGEQLRAIYDAWFAGKVSAARDALTNSEGGGE